MARLAAHRNAQSALSVRRVEYLVAMTHRHGLNLDVDHVAFASDRKVRRYQFRRLNPAELAQIAGRAGRASRDGLSVPRPLPPFRRPAGAAGSLRSAIQVLQVRNTRSIFSLGALQARLPRPRSRAHRAPVAEDIWCSTRRARRRCAQHGDHAGGDRAAVGGVSPGLCKSRRRACRAAMALSASDAGRQASG